MSRADVDYRDSSVDADRRARRTPSATRLLVLAVGVLIACCGCRLDVGVDINMTADGTGTVTVTASADSALVAAAPSALADLRLDDIRQAGWNVTGPAKNADGSMTLQLAKPFASPAEATAILAELNGPNGPLRGLTVSIDRSFALVASTLSGHAQLTGGLGAFSDAALAQALGAPPLANLVTAPVDQVLAVTVSAHFAGTVVTTDGQAAADGQSVEWRPSLADGVSTPVNARFELVDRGARSARRTSQLAWRALAIYLGVLLLVIVVVLVLLRHRRRTRRRTPPTNPVTPPS
jgi:hypothetical protein